MYLSLLNKTKKQRLTLLLKSGGLHYEKCFKTKKFLEVDFRFSGLSAFHLRISVV